MVATVVLVDDDEALLRALRFSLELDGFRVIACADGETVPVDTLPRVNGCLVLDYHLPDMDGLELLARLRGRSVALPVILITSHFSQALRGRAEAAGAVLVEKPLLGDALPIAIRAALASAGPPC